MRMFLSGLGGFVVGGALVLAVHSGRAAKAERQSVWARERCLVTLGYLGDTLVQFSTNAVPMERCSGLRFLSRRLFVSSFGTNKAGPFASFVCPSFDGNSNQTGYVLWIKTSREKARMEGFRWTNYWGQISPLNDMTGQSVWHVYPKAWDLCPHNGFIFNVLREDDETESLPAEGFMSYMEAVMRHLRECGPPEDGPTSKCLQSWTSDENCHR